MDDIPMPDSLLRALAIIERGGDLDKDEALALYPSPGEMVEEWYALFAALAAVGHVMLSAWASSVGEHPSDLVATLRRVGGGCQ